MKTRAGASSPPRPCPPAPSRDPFLRSWRGCGLCGVRLWNPLESPGPARQRHDWGSSTATPELLRSQPDDDPWAEARYSTHPAGRTRLADGASPAALIDSGPPQRLLGEDVVRRFGARLPYLLTIIAPQRTLSPQVHPGLDQAADGYARENEAGPALEDPERSHRDASHKPETVLALTRFEAVAGFRAPRRAVEVLSGLDSAPAHRMRRTLRLNPTRFGIRQVFLHRPGRRPGPPQRPGDQGAGGADRRPP